MSQSNRNWVLSARYAENQAHRELGSVRYQHKPSEYKQECTVQKKTVNRISNKAKNSR